MNKKIILISLILLVIIAGAILFLVLNKESSQNENSQTSIEKDCENNPSVCFICYNDSNGLRYSNIPIENKNYCKAQCLSNPDACYIKLAKETSNIDFCKKIEKRMYGLDYNYLCYANVAKSTKNEAICNLITNEDKEYEQTARTSCINFVRN